MRHFGAGMGVPASFVKYGGSALWGAMVYVLVSLFRGNWPGRKIALVTFMVAAMVEFFRLIHTPWLDAFRLTLWGALLLGRVFSLWNILAYGLGILIGWWLDSVLVRKASSNR